MLTNKLNIGDKAVVNLKNPKVCGEGEVGRVTQIQLMNNEIYYTLELENNFEDGGCLPIKWIQVKEGQYKEVK